MIIRALLLLFFLGLPLTAGAQTAELFINDKAVNPLCFVGLGENDNVPPYPVEDCDSELMPDPEMDISISDDRFAATVYKHRTEKFVRGSVGYTYLGDLDGHKTVWTFENSGGSGTFSQLMLLDRDQEQNVLTVHETYAFGDRCLGGVADARIEDGDLVYERHVTPYDIIGLVGDPEREILQSDAALQLPVCAACCYARAQFSGHDLTGITFEPFLPANLEYKEYSDDRPAEKCFDDLVTLNIAAGHDAFDTEGLEALVREIEHVCLGRVEGE